MVLGMHRVPSAWFWVMRLRDAGSDAGQLVTGFGAVKGDFDAVPSRLKFLFLLYVWFSRKLLV